MKHITLSEFGAPDVMSIGESENPTIRDNEVLIKVKAAGVNRPDVAQRQGLYPPPKGASTILGLEVAGEITEIGSHVDKGLLGASVCALTNGGGYAEYVAVPVSQCLPMPRGYSFVQAAALPETFFTVWTNVFDRAKLQAGESFLVHGGSSGIGSAAIQLAKARGATVFATAGSDEKCDYCKKLGADVAINYRTEDFVKIISEVTNENGIDVILDMVGGDYIQKNIQIAALDGRIVNIAFLGGAQATINFLPIMMKRLVITGSTLRPQTIESKAAIAKSLKKEVWPLLESGKIAPHIAAEFTLSEASKAHTLMESSEHMGKIVLTL
ncbi:MAG: NAD(P)H-quinone oxidoreductase [Cellvibrionaceae bacterium]